MVGANSAAIQAVEKNKNRTHVSPLPKGTETRTTDKE
jgi:hypothetical protein